MYRKATSILVALLVLVSVLGAVQPVKAEPTINAVVPATISLVYFTSQNGPGSEWVNFTATLNQKMALTFTLIPNTVVGELLIDGSNYTSQASDKIVLNSGTHTIAIKLVYSDATSGLNRINLNYNLTFPWTIKVDNSGYPYTSLTFNPGVSIGPYPNSPGTPPLNYYAQIDFKGNNVAYVTCDQVTWNIDGTRIFTYLPTGAQSLTLTVGFKAPPVSMSLVRVVDNFGQPINKLPGDFARILIGSQLTVQPLVSNLTIIHLVNNTVVNSFTFDKATLYKWGVVAYRLYSKDYVYPIINATSGQVTPKKLNVNYQLVAPEQVPFTVKLEGDLTRVGMYPLDFIVNGATVGTLSNTEKVYIDGTVSTIGSYSVTETSDTYNVTIDYNVVVNTLTHPYIDKVYTFEPVSITTSKVYLTLPTSRPFLLHSTRKVVRITGSSVGDVNIGSNGDVYFAGVTTGDTYTVKLATQLLVKNLYNGQPTDATVTIYDTKGNVIAQNSGKQVIFQLEPTVTYLVQGDNGAEKQSKSVYLTDDMEVDFTYNTAPAFQIPLDYVYLVFFAIITFAVVYLVWKLRKGGLSIEIEA